MKARLVVNGILDEAACKTRVFAADAARTWRLWIRGAGVKLNIATAPQFDGTPRPGFGGAGGRYFCSGIVKISYPGLASLAVAAPETSPA